MKILLVDDDAFGREMLGRRLTRQNLELRTADSGPAALRELAAGSFDLMLLDVRMPGMSGLDVLDRVRREHSPMELPVIMVTAESDSHAIVEALRLGANDYVTKPIDFPVALARIKTHLSLKAAIAALKESEERYALAARGANDGLWDWDLRINEIHYSVRWKEMIGHGQDELGPTPEEWFSRVHPEDLKRLKADLEAHLTGITTQFENEHRMRRKDGAYRWMLSRGLAVWDERHKPTRIVGSQTDITAGKVADALTGLPNRLQFSDRVERAIRACRASSENFFAVLFLDLDRFKNINDSMGHLAGDELLQQVAARLRSALRVQGIPGTQGERTLLSRLGGDEFAVLLETAGRAGDVREIAERLAASLGAPFSLGGHDVFVTVSIGIAIGHGGYDRPEDLLRDADTAMYCAKDNGRARYAIFDERMRTRAVSRLQLETDLRRAIDRHELIVSYQPIVTLTDFRIDGFEALVRWNHPHRGLVYPGEFIPLAEETGLVIPLGEAVLAQALEDLHVFLRARPGVPISLHVNLSAVQLSQPHLGRDIIANLERSGLAPSDFHLKLEITESTLLANPENVARLVQRLEEWQVGVSIDDFGTGYSSLSQLHNLPVQTLKIDRSFVGHMSEQGDGEIVRTIIALAHNMGIMVVAEGVETKAQADKLRGLGCEFGQGYYFSPPRELASALSLWATEPAGTLDSLHHAVSAHPTTPAEPRAAAVVEEAATRAAAFRPLK